MNGDREKVDALLAEKQAIGETNAHSANTHFHAEAVARSTEDCFF